VVRVQALSGTGALRLGTEFLARFYPGYLEASGAGAGATRTVLLPNPTWGNHIPICEDAGLRVGKYRYYDARTCGLDISGMLEDLRAAPARSIVMLHACAHNPTGVDPTPAQWQQIASVVKVRLLVCMCRL
jgi:aspartate aminotransferase, mitochondrial